MITTDAPAGTAPTRSRPLPRPLVRQDWVPVLFLHWRIPAVCAQPFMPSGVSVDTWEDCSFASLVLTGLSRTTVGPVQLPYLGTFRQVNLRLYSVDAAGRHGVVFVSLRAERLVSAALGRLARQPYSRDRIRHEQQGPSDAWRVGSATQKTRAVVGGIVGPAVERDGLEHWLTNRWGTHTTIGPWTMWAPVSHPPWSFRAMTLVRFESTLFDPLGLPVSGPPDLRALWSAGVPATLGIPHRL